MKRLHTIQNQPARAKIFNKQPIVFYCKKKSPKGIPVRTKLLIHSHNQIGSFYG